jgi:hypothetical protein
MPIQPDEQRRTDLIRAELLDIGLVWNKQYRLIDEGPRWEFEFMEALTPAQYNRANELLEMIMNR